MFSSAFSSVMFAAILASWFPGWRQIAVFVYTLVWCALCGLHSVEDFLVFGYSVLLTESVYDLIIFFDVAAKQEYGE